MNILRMLKWPALATFLVLTLFAYLYFRVWLQPPEPEVLSVRWDKPTVAFGEERRLLVSARVPWHCKLSEAPRPRPPNGFVLSKIQPAPEVSAPRWDGYRSLELDLRLVQILPSASDTAKSLNLSLPTSFGAADTAPLAVSLPPLKLESPEQLASDLAWPGSWDGSQGPVAEAETLESRTPLWLQIIGFVLFFQLIAFLLFLTFYKGRKPAPELAWRRALKDIKTLSRQRGLEDAPFYARLTEILKRYLADRDARPSTMAATTLDLDTLLADYPGISADLHKALGTANRTADTAKFASKRLGRTNRKAAIKAVRRAIEATKPKEEITHG